MSSDSTESKKTPKYTDHNGFLMPYGFPAQNFENALGYQPRPNDVFIATYPKCGTTLTQHMVYIMLNNGQPIEAHEKLDRLFPHIEEVGADYVNDEENAAKITRSNRRLLKTHLPYEMTPVNTTNGSKYIFIARNPKDCVVSFFHHTRGFGQHYDFEEGDFDVYFDLFCRGKVDFGDYFNTLKSWMDRRNDPHVLFVKYEDIRENKASVVKEIAKFIDADLDLSKISRNSGNVGGNPDIEVTTASSGNDTKTLLDKILYFSSLEEMKKDPLRWSSERKSNQTPFIRKGVVGGWKELLTEAQGEVLNGIMKKKFSSEELELLGSKYS
mmetsp:Transcript_11632/g.16986  ORF Transcript_11632/g.16986 Transcript_11632/m.16986 type:complete len:326 (-) Transcript_11632:56-1033(-)